MSHRARLFQDPEKPLPECLTCGKRVTGVGPSLRHADEPDPTLDGPPSDRQDLTARMLGEPEAVRPVALARPRARRSDPDTSHAAAASVKGLRASQEAVLAVLVDAGMFGLTDEQIAARYPADAPRQSPSGLRTRRAELVTAGKVKDSGRRERMTSGRGAVVWEALT